MPSIDLTHFFELLDAIETPDDAEFLYDASDAHGALRRRNLVRYLELMASVEPEVLLLAEAPGYRGMTVSGIPFTSVRQLDARPGLITRAAEGDGLEVPEHPHAQWEASSSIVWRALASWRGPLPLLWGVYPNHPFVRGDRMTNRAPRPAEVRAGAPIALELARAFGVEVIAAVGRKAQGAMAAAGVEAPALRHPAQGGAATFTAQLADLNERMLVAGSASPCAPEARFNPRNGSSDTSDEPFALSKRVSDVRGRDEDEWEREQEQEQEQEQS